MEENEILDAARQKFNLAIWKRLIPYIKKFKKSFIIIITTTVFMAFIDILMPIFMGYAINNFVVPQSTKGLLAYSVLYITMLMLQALSVVFFAHNAMGVEMSFGKDMRRDCFVKLQQLSLSYYNKNPVGQIMSRVMSDTRRIAELVAWSGNDILWTSLYIIGVFTAMLILNVKLALMVIVIVPVVAVITLIFEGKILSTNKIVRAMNAKVTGAYNEGIVGAKTSKTLVIEDKNCRDFNELSGKLKKHNLIYVRLNAMFTPIVVFCGSLATATVLMNGGYMVMEDVIEFGTLSAFISYALGILEPVQMITAILAEFIGLQVNIERVTDLVNEECEIKDSEVVIKKYGDVFNSENIAFERIKGDIEFKNVWFKYPDSDEYIFEDFSLKIPAGTNVAIVGETGAGKSTMVNLACRFFEPTKGQILIDGVDYRERSQLWLQSQLGYVLQNPHLFSGSVKENIVYGKLDATDEEIRRAASLVSADKVVEKLENGYDTDVGEGGDRLSTGEKQLISFARAIITDPPIFVLDEATSSIDTETEHLIQNAISKILKGRTSFLIAHRLSTIRHADLILVVRNGKIIEKGTHNELIAKDGYYASLCNNTKINSL